MQALSQRFGRTRQRRARSEASRPLLLHADRRRLSETASSIARAVALESSRNFSMAVAQHIMLTAQALACMRFRPLTRYLLSGSTVEKTERKVITRFVEREGGYAAGPGPVAYHHRTMTRTLVRSVRRRSAHVLMDCRHAR